MPVEAKAVFDIIHAFKIVRIIRMKKSLIAFLAVSLLSACSSFIYRIDIPQGNYLVDKDIEKLRIGMSKEQVLYVLGKPVLQDSFADNKWYYVYDMKSGKTGEIFKKRFTLEFEEQKLKSASGDFKLSDDFNTPIE